MVAKKRALGKGLSALIPDEPLDEILDIEEARGTIINIGIDNIRPNEKQPRKEFDSDSLKELTHSIKNYGVIQPIIVRKVGNFYEIVAGERRWKASKSAGLKEVPCIVKEMEDLEAIKIALIENLQREDLNPVEEARAFKELMENYKLTQEEVSQVVGKSRSYIANSLRLLKLDDDTIKRVEEGQLTSGHGRALLSIKDKDERKKTADKIVNNKLNVREVEQIASESKKRKPKEKVVDPILTDLEESLMYHLGTKVQITRGKNHGKIEIDFYSEEDLERIFEVILHE